jgi:hypothetical protein
MRPAFVAMFAGCGWPSSASAPPPPKPVASVPNTAPAVAAPPAARVFSVGTGNIVRGWHADAFEDGRVEGHRWGYGDPGDDQAPFCTVALEAADVAAHARDLMRCCGMKVRSLGEGELPVDQRWIEVQLGERVCRTMQSDVVWGADAEAHACQEALTALWRQTCGQGR